jgi:hypothetical protein
MAKDTAQPFDALEDVHTDLLIQACALEKFEAVLLEEIANDSMADLATVLLDAVVANIRRDAEEIGNALDAKREGVA